MNVPSPPDTFSNVSRGGGEITDVRVIAAPEKKRNNIMLAMDEGRVIVCDNTTLLVRAASNPPGDRLKGMTFGKKTGEKEIIYTVADTQIDVIRYRPFYLRTMRTD